MISTKSFITKLNWDGLAAVNEEAAALTTDFGAWGEGACAGAGDGALTCGELLGVDGLNCSFEAASCFATTGATGDVAALADAAVFRSSSAGAGETTQAGAQPEEDGCAPGPVCNHQVAHAAYLALSGQIRLWPEQYLFRPVPSSTQLQQVSAAAVVENLLQEPEQTGSLCVLSAKLLPALTGCLYVERGQA